MQEPDAIHGALIIICRNQGGAYIVTELDGTVWRNPVGAFRLILYQSQYTLPLPDLDDFLDILMKELEDMVDASNPDLNDNLPMVDEPD